MEPTELDPHFDHITLEAEARALWEEAGIHRFDPDGDAPLYSVDTPPPYVSAAHLHVGHAMSYTQAEILVRWHRMKGHRVFYPMGFDDNGLPTERYVERTHNVDKATTSRSAFRALCLEETTRGATAYEHLWRGLGLSVDWSLRYSTIDDHCRRTAQWSFLQLFQQGRIYRSDDPVLWDPAMQTALAQADLATQTRRQKLHTVHFTADGRSVSIATTRPELLPACVALYHHPDDARYAGLTTATEPLEGRRVPVRTDDDVDPEFGTGLMMVCTFGDGEDVRRWKRDGLDTRPIVGPDGTLTALAGPLAGLTVALARKRVPALLGEAYGGFMMREQAVPIADRTEAPVEWILAPQWFLRVLDRKDALRARSDALRWHPPHMKARLDHWIDGLKWDWNLSRQRFYGVPFPVWLCTDCAHPVLAAPESLPVDPLEDPPPCAACPECGGMLRGDADVMDTWMTSSLTPYINANSAGTPGRTAGPAPMTVRVQAFEIIRSWLFYTLVKADLQFDALPWRDVMISGWGLNEQGKKISKRDLMHRTEGFNRYDPGDVIARWGADALRHWAGSGHLGHDLRYHTRGVKAGRKTVVKLWNAGRLASQNLGGFDPDRPVEHAPEDRDLLHHLDATARIVDEGMAAYDYAIALAALDRFFFGTFCDDWLEMVKPRLAGTLGADSRAAAQATLAEALRTLLGLYAPTLPFVTEALWQRLYRPIEGGVSLHTTAFPLSQGRAAVPELDRVRQVLRSVRGARSAGHVPQSRRVARLTIQGAPELSTLTDTLRSACRADAIQFTPGTELVVTVALADG
ncbi:MAG: valyl-tRNA synthetase [Myxococcota bacterium]|jgi:valyl-tRNA synthetase